MSQVLVIAVAIALAAVQLSARTLTGEVAALPVLPLAYLAAWAVVRDPASGALALPFAALALGVASEYAVGLALLALLPALALATALRALLPGHAVAAAGAAAAIGSVAYLALLAAGIDAAALTLRGGLAASAATTAAWTGAAAMAIASALLALQPRERGMFQ